MKWVSIFFAIVFFNIVQAGNAAGANDRYSPPRANSDDEAYPICVDDITAGDQVRACTFIIEHSRIDDELAEAHAHRCIALVRIEKFSEAKADCDQAIEYSSGFGYAYYARSQLKASQGDQEGSRSDLQVANRVGIYATLTEQLSGAGSPSADPAAGLVARREQERDREASETALHQNCLGASPVNRNAQVESCTAIIGLQRSTTKFDLAEAYAHRCDAVLALNNGVAAEPDCDAAINELPTFVFAYFVRGNVRLMSHNYGRAISDFDRAVVLSRQGVTNLTEDSAVVPLSAIYLARGNAHADIKDFKSAISDFSAAIELNPNESQFFEARADARAQLGNKRGSKADRAQAKRLNANEGATDSDD